MEKVFSLTDQYKILLGPHAHSKAILLEENSSVTRHPMGNFHTSYGI